MELYILDQNRVPVAVIDSFTSLIWTTRYYTCGDFELYLPADKSLLEFLSIDNFIVRDDAQSVMIIEKIEITTSAEDGDFIIVSGRSAESLLSRRIIWTQTNISVSDPADGIRTLVSQNTINTSAARIIPDFSVDTTFTKTGTLNVQFTGDNLMDAVTEICTEFGIGFKVTLENGVFVFGCYEGRAVDVTFSPEFDNLINSDYSYDMTEYGNCGLTAGEGEGTARKTVSVRTTQTEPSGLARREVYIDARDLSSNAGEISDTQYMNMLSQRGYEKLTESAAKESFESEIEPNMTYRYKTDYDLGDVVTVTNEYGISANPRIIEIIESRDENGYKVIPTFEKKEVG